MAIRPIGPRGVKRQKRRAKRRDKEDRKNDRKVDLAALGGSKAEEKKLYDEARTQAKGTVAREKESYRDMIRAGQRTRAEEAQSDTEYDASRAQAGEAYGTARGAVSGIGSAAKTSSGVLGAAGSAAQDEYTRGAQSAVDQRMSALGQNQLTGSAESILAQRQAAVSGAPTIGAAAETALQANAANARSQLAQNLGLANRQAMGLAAGQGEGGALAMQQAVAQSAQGGLDTTMASQLQQNELAAQMRYNAAATQNTQDIAAADQAAQMRLGAAQAERQAALGFADANAAQSALAAQQRAATGLQIGGAQAELGYNAAAAQQAAYANLANQSLSAQHVANARQQSLLGQANSVTTNTEQAALEARGADQANQANLLTAKYNAQREQDKAPDRKLWQKTVMPFGILGS